MLIPVTRSDSRSLEYLSKTIVNNLDEMNIPQQSAQGKNVAGDSLKLHVTSNNISLGCLNKEENNE